MGFLDDLFSGSDFTEDNVGFDDEHPEDYSHAEDMDHSNLEMSHYHIMKKSQAVDTDGDGYSDAVERREGTDPDNEFDHPYTYIEHGEIHTSIKDDLSGTVDLKHHGSDIGDYNEHHGEIEEGMNNNSMEGGIRDGIDSDHDGFSDEIEEFLKTDSGNIASHPSIVMPKHYTIWDQAEKQNLDGTFDSMKDIDPA